MLDFIGDVQSETLRKNLQKLLMVGITSGAVRPLTYCIFSKDEIEPAYRYMAAGKHIGKLTIPRDGPSIRAAMPAFTKKSFAQPAPGEEIYITGIAGSYPDCHSVHELQEKLFNKVDLISGDYRRWKCHDTDTPQRTGKIYDLEKFDASFFDVNYVRANVTDPGSRILHERVYEAIVDAGYNISELRKHKVGVYIGTGLIESDYEFNYLQQKLHPYGTVSNSHIGVATNISQWLGVEGPSYTVDTACSSSAYALEHAVKALRDGLCDVAIAGGAHLCLSPFVSFQFFHLGVLSPDGRCKCFDQKADGYARSETIAVVLLQRAKHARRVYAEVIHAKTNCDGYKEQGITYPAGHIQKELLQNFYQECGVRPAEVEFVEAHGTGTQVGDPEELKAIDEVFCKGRSSPLMIGSSKSNLGHTEFSSGICSLSKLVIAYHTGYIPPNINFEKYREGVAGFEEGRMVVVTEKQPWSRGLSACSSFGFGGANAHLLLKSVAKDKVNNGLPLDDLPRLVCVSGRTRSSVAKVLDHLHSNTVDVDEIRPWHAVHEHDIPGHPFRGYTLLGSTPTKSILLARDIGYFKNIDRAVWLVYPGLGVQWSGMAATMMKLPTFAAALQKCNQTLKDIDLVKFITNPPIKVLDNVLHSVVAVAAIQIGLSDVLKTVSIKPDNIIGYGVGQLGSAYMSGALTSEQAILAAYYIGKALDKTGHLDDTSGSNLLMELKQVITSPKLRQELVKSILDPGSLDDAVEKVPSNIVVVEVAPDSQLKEKQYDFSKVSLGQKNEDGLRFLLVAIGKLFQAGLNPTLASLYPHVEFPVAQGTSMLSHLIEWDHREDWPKDVLFDYTLKQRQTVSIVNLEYDDDQKYLAGHVIDGRNLYPATGYLQLVWQTLSRIHGYQMYSDMSVVFENVSFNRATTIPKNSAVEFVISIHGDTGNFEVLEGDTAVVTGRVYEQKNVGANYRVISDAPERAAEHKDNFTLTAKDFYKELNLRGYQYKGLFRSVLDSNLTGTLGHIQWQDNWVSFLDAMMQPLIVTHDTRALYVPTRIEKISIDVDIHYNILQKIKDNLKSYKFQSFPQLQVLRISGIELRGLHVTAISKKPALGIPVFEKNEFIPNYMQSKMLIEDILRSDFQLIFENIHTYKFKTIEFIDEQYEKNEITPIVEAIGDILSDMPLVQAELLVLSEKTMEFPPNVQIANKKITSESNAIVIVGANLLERPNVLTEAINTLKEGCFVMSREKSPPNPSDYSKSDYDITTVHYTGFEFIVLIRKKPKSRKTKFFQLVSGDETFSWVEKLKEEMKDNTEKLVIYSQNESVNGLLGLVNCLRREPGGESVYGLLITDPKAPAFKPDSEFINQQLGKNLAMNVYQNGAWGTYRHLLIDEPEPVDSPHAYVNVTTVGDLSSLRWLQGPFKLDQSFKQTNLKLLHVYCSALNFRDVMTASGRVTLDAVARGRLAQECVQGLEVSGRILNGTRVMAVTDRGICNLARCEKSLMWCIPDEWTFEEAATVPVAYTTVYMALILIGKIKSGESILIHAGSGGVGQAAISVALHHGLEVFTTVGTPAKREFIKKLFPQLKDSYIGNSRDTSFEDMIRRKTNGKGVHVVLNSLADDKLQASVKCLRRRGRFLEIGKYDITNNTILETYLFRNEISFHGVMLDFIGDVQSESLRQNLQKLLVVGITSGAVRPLTYCIFSKDEIEPAYRYMAAGKHIGKVIIKIRDGEPKSSRPVRPVAAPIKALPRYTCNEDGVYVLLGGLGGFGLELADWLVLRGARKLVLCSRKGISKGYQTLRIRIWESYGVVVQIATDDVTAETGCAAMLKRAKTMGPVEAVFNLAVVLKDAVFQNQTQETFKESYGPKALATMHLDKLTRVLCPELKDFVIFSSVSCGRGNAGQTNYGFSNSVMERICEIRKKDGLPALAIQWGAIGDVGLVADMQEDNIQLEIGGTLQQRIVSCLQAMDMFLKQDAPIISSIVVAEKRSGGASSGTIVDAVAAIMGIKDLRTVSHQASLADLGMDSIMAVEIKQTLERDYELFLSAQEIRTLSLAKLVEYTNKIESDETTSSDTKEVEPDNKENNISLMIKDLGDEKHAAKSSVWLPTLASSNKSKGETVFMMPGIESCASTLKMLCSRLQSRACVLQLGVDHKDEVLDEMVDRLYPIVKSQLSPGEHFHILGYSFGTLVMLKMAAKLEKDGHNGHVICLDGSPEYLNCLVECLAGDDHIDDSNFQDHFIEKVARLTLPNNEFQNLIIQEIQKYKTFEEKIDIGFSLYHELVKENQVYSIEYMKAIISALYHRMKVILDSYKNMNVRLKAPITLIRSKSLPIKIECSDDYGLNALSGHPVTVHYLDETHAHIMDGEDCAAIVNKIIEDAIITVDPEKTRTRVIMNLLEQSTRAVEM